MKNIESFFNKIGRKDAKNIAEAAESWLAGNPIKNDGGEIAKLFSGTPRAGFDTFDKRLSGTNTNADDARHFSVWASDNPEVASQYAMTSPRDGVFPSNFPETVGRGGTSGGVMPLIGKSSSPLIKEMGGAAYSPKMFRDIIKEAVDGGNDAIILRNVNDALFGNIQSNVYGLREPSQVKSIFNRGTFDPNDPNILKAALPFAAGAGLMSSMSPSEAEAAQRIRAMDGPIEEAWNPIEAFGGGLGGGLRAALAGILPDGAMDWGINKIGGLMSGGK